MKHAYLIVTDKIDLETMVQLNTSKYVDTFLEISDNDAGDLKRMAAYAIERYKQTKAYKDGWIGYLATFEEYKTVFGRLFHLLRYRRE